MERIASSAMLEAQIADVLSRGIDDNEQLAELGRHAIERWSRRPSFPAIPVRHRRRRRRTPSGMRWCVTDEGLANSFLSPTAAKERAKRSGRHHTSWWRGLVR